MSFHFRPVLTLFAALGMAMLIGLGSWQLQRLEWKRGLIARVEARIGAAPAPFAEIEKLWTETQDADYTPVVARGAFRHDLEAHVFGTLDGTAGYYIFTPLELAEPIDGARFVYVNRGFAPMALKDPARRPEGEIEGEVTVRGLFRGPGHARGVAALVAPVDDPAGNSWYQREPVRFAAAAGISALPVYIDSFGDETPGEWPKGGVTEVEFFNRHLEYALTWFGLAATLAGVWLAFSMSRR
jgi:surfeit locus 1 family protein